MCLHGQDVLVEQCESLMAVELGEGNRHCVKTIAEYVLNAAVAGLTNGHQWNTQAPRLKLTHSRMMYPWPEHAPVSRHLRGRIFTSDGRAWKPGSKPVWTASSNPHGPSRLIDRLPF